jgi:ATP-dependent DNA helicase RecG
MLNLDTPIEKLAHVGPRHFLRLKRLGIKIIRDLLWHFPARYEDFSTILPIAQVEAGTVVNIKGRVVDIATTSLWRRRKTVTNAAVEDESGMIHAVWFNQPYIEKSLPEGTMVSLAGKTVIDKKGLYLSSPVYEKIYGRELTHTGRLVPVYPETEGITSKYLRFLVKPLLANVKNLPDLLPEELIKKYNLPKLDNALRSIHFPTSNKEAELARQRFALEELLLFQLRVLRDHRQLQTLRAPVINFDEKLIAAFVGGLPFQLTNDQRIAAYEILQDLKRNYPMNRLLNGDVGSGKTVVALIAAYQAVLARHQAVFMAPTEILAEQHFRTVKLLLDMQKTNGITVGLLTGSGARQFPADELTNEKVSKELMLQKIAKGQINIIIGTHAVIQKNVKFKDLGLVVIDEQHRFGVEQRMKLVKGQTLVPHFLSMTATPIPRTLALTIFGDLDISLLKEKPKGRQAIVTKVIAASEREKAHKFIEEEIQKGRQIFVICPRIELATSENFALRQAQGKPISQMKLVWAEARAVAEEYKKLAETIFPHRRVAMLHGRMKSAEKNKIMEDFKNGHHDILVSTSVVEVGVDIPNASIMMIESAERFGLAQLHQFRGRVGRGEHQSCCLLFTDSDTALANRRLRALEKTDNGFELAEMDLKIRGPGEFSGIKQSGIPDFAMASLADVELIKKARLEAKLLLRKDPTLKNYPLLLTRLARMQRLVHFE